MINNQKLISVIIPTFNRAKLIKDAINSVIGQTYQNFELLIIDDGSTDNTSEVVNSIGDTRIKYIYQENTGVSRARNNGIENASGEYIAFLDSDDLWHPEKLEKQALVLDQNPDVDIVTNSSQYQTFLNDIIGIKYNRAKNQKEVISLMLLYQDMVYTGTPVLCVRKSIFEKSGMFDEEMRFCEDWDLFFRMALVGKVYNIPEILTYVRSHTDNVTKTSPVNNFKDGKLLFLNKAFSNELLPPEMLQLKKRAYSNSWWSFAYWGLYLSNDCKIARECFWKSLKYNPRKIFDLGFFIALILSYLPAIFLRKYMHLRKLMGKSY